MLKNQACDWLLRAKGIRVAKLSRNPIHAGPVQKVLVGLVSRGDEGLDTGAEAEQNFDLSR